MFDSIVIGLDGHEGGDDALSLARRLASPGARLLGVRVDVRDAWSTRAANADFEASVHGDLVAALVDEVGDVPGVTLEVVIAGSVAVGLHKAAGRHGADLIVIGTSDRRTLGRMLAGDDTRATLHDAPCAVAVAPRGYAGTQAPIAVVGVGWDAQPHSEAALAVARDVAATTAAELRSLEVVGLPDWPGVGTLNRDIDTVVGEDDPAPAPAVASSTPSLASDHLRHFAQELDLLVVGTRQRGVVARTLLGSTSDSLSTDLGIPLLVVSPEHAPSSTRA